MKTGRSTLVSRAASEELTHGKNWTNQKLKSSDIHKRSEPTGHTPVLESEFQLVEAELSMETIAVETVAMVEKPQLGCTHCWRLRGTGLRLSGDSGGAKACELYSQEHNLLP